MKAQKVHPETKCKGLRFRAFSNFYVKDGSFVENRGFRLLKRQSCTGCKECRHTWDFVKEVLCEYGELPVKNNTAIDTSKDYGISIDDVDMEFYPLNNKVYK